MTQLDSDTAHDSRRGCWRFHRDGTDGDICVGSLESADESRPDGSRARLQRKRLHRRRRQRVLTLSGAPCVHTHCEHGHAETDRAFEVSYPFSSRLNVEALGFVHMVSGCQTREARCPARRQSRRFARATPSGLAQHRSGLFQLLCERRHTECLSQVVADQRLVECLLLEAAAGFELRAVDLKPAIDVR